MMSGRVRRQTHIRIRQAAVVRSVAVSAWRMLASAKLVSRKMPTIIPHPAGARGAKAMIGTRVSGAAVGGWA